MVSVARMVGEKLKIYRTILLTVLILVMVNIVSYAEENMTGGTGSETGNIQGSAAAKNSGDDGQTLKPEPYGENEFPGWLKDLRRGEIIFFGSIPFMLFFSFESYDLYRYFSNGMNPGYSPWPFRGYNAIPYTDSEKAGILISSLSLSLIVAIGDYLLGLFGESKNSGSNEVTANENQQNTSN